MYGPAFPGVIEDATVSIQYGQSQGGWESALGWSAAWILLPMPQTMQVRIMYIM
jgi:hypothetical protein